MPRHPALLAWKSWAIAWACCAALAGCAAPEWQKLGSSAEQVAGALGQPHARTPLPQGGERWVYSRQPSGQQAFHLVFDAQQRLQRIEQVLQEVHFLRLQSQQDTRATVLAYFGPPALIEGAASFKGEIWTYRISENNFDRLAHVFIDPQGVVQRVMFTDEPRSEPDSRD